jgi:hypothetical protein
MPNGAPPSVASHLVRTNESGQIFPGGYLSTTKSRGGLRSQSPTWPTSRPCGLFPDAQLFSRNPARWRSGAELFSYLVVRIAFVRKASEFFRIRIFTLERAIYLNRATGKHTLRHIENGALAAGNVVLGKDLHFSLLADRHPERACKILNTK